ncbi:MAG: TonB-dependent receptor [bacterium]
MSRAGSRIAAVLLAMAMVTVVSAQTDLPAAVENIHCLIEGKVLDNATREPIGAANVIVVGLPRGAATDLEGRFLITHLPPGTFSVTASALGYEPMTLLEIAISPGRPGNAEFLLKPTVLQAEAVTVTAEIIEVSPTEMPTSSRTLRYEEVRRAPGGLEDIQRMVQALPGVVNSNDSDNEIVVRGGSPRENLTVIDGIEVDNTNHLTFGDEGQGGGGPINALNTQFLEDVTFASGGFSARYGDRMSSVLDLNLREGNRDRTGGSADFNMAGAGGHFETPLPGKRGSLLWTAKHSYLQLLPEGTLPTGKAPVYWNSQAKLTYDLSSRHHLTVNGFYAQDEQTFRPQDLAKTNGEETFSAGIDGLDFNTEKHFFGARLRSLWGVAYTDLIVARTEQYAHWDQYDQRPDQSLRRIVSNRRTDANDQIHLLASGRALNNDEWGAGVSLKSVYYTQKLFAIGDSLIYNDDVLGVDPGTEPDTFYYDDVCIDADKRGLKQNAFVQYTWRPGRGVSLTAGVRQDALDISGENVFAPRVSAVWDFYPRWTLSAAWGVYYQSQNLGDYFNPGAKGANESLPDSRAAQYVSGISFNPKPSLRLSIEGYFKDYDRLLVSRQDVVREQTGDLTFQSDVMLPERTKKAWGVEFFIHQKLANRWYGMLSYSYGKAEATNPAFGAHPDDYDMPHVFTGLVGYRTSLLRFARWRKLLATPVLGWMMYALPINGDELILSTRYRCVSGRPYTRQVWYDEGVQSPEPLTQSHWESEGHNNERFPDYTRWDLRVDSKYWFGSSALVVYLSIENVLDERNVADYFYDDEGHRKIIEQFRQMYILGLRYEF